LKVINDILKDNGKWSYKRVTAFYVLNISIIYAFLPAIKPKFTVLEFVMMSLIGYSASMAGLTIWQKKLENKTDE
jgi:hypothetical protein